MESHNIIEDDMFALEDEIVVEETRDTSCDKSATESTGEVVKERTTNLCLKTSSLYSNLDNNKNEVDEDDEDEDDLSKEGGVEKEVDAELTVVEPLSPIADLIRLKACKLPIEDVRDILDYAHKPENAEDVSILAQVLRLVAHNDKKKSDVQYQLDITKNNNDELVVKAKQYNDLKRKYDELKEERDNLLEVVSNEQVKKMKCSRDFKDQMKVLEKMVTEVLG